MFLAPVREQVARDASSSLAVIEQCGHVCNVGQPEQFNFRTLAFIQSLGEGGNNPLPQSRLKQSGEYIWVSASPVCSAIPQE